MKIALVELHTPNYNSMADITLPGKISYANKHGYTMFVKTDNFVPNIHVGFQKCFWMYDLMIANPDIDWFWHTGTDCMITNSEIKLESLIDENFHFIVTKDDHGIGANVFFIRNTHEGREYMKHLQDPHPASGSEQGHMWDDEYNPIWRPITKYLPQHTMNSYYLKYYPHKTGKDVFGQRSQWIPGDFMVQVITGLMPPGMSPEDIYNWKMNIFRDILHEINETQ